jgi:hypothetical protein
VQLTFFWFPIAATFVQVIFFIPFTYCLYCLMPPHQSLPDNAITALGRSPLPSFACHSCSQCFHDRGGHTKHIVAKHNVDALGPQSSSSSTLPPSPTDVAMDLHLNLNEAPPDFNFDREPSRNSSPGPQPESDPPHLTCVYHPMLNGEFSCVIRTLIQLCFDRADQ